MYKLMTMSKTQFLLSKSNLSSAMEGTSESPYDQFLSTPPPQNHQNDDDIESVDHEHEEQPPPNVSPFTDIIEEQVDHKSYTNKRYKPLLVFNYLLLFVGSVSASLLSKYYFNHNGSSKWVSTLVQSAGFPILLIPIFLPPLFHCTKRRPFTDFHQNMLWYSIFVGFMLGFNNLLISWGVSYLPVSTSALLLSSQLVFTLIMSVIIVKQKITFSNLNCVVLITLSSILLALNNSNERPEGLTQKQYFIGFFCTIGAGLCFSLYLPIMEMIYKQVYSYEMVMEMQLIMEIAATVVAVIGMTCDEGFDQMKKEAKIFDKGSTLYWVTIFSTVVAWQCCFMGTAGMVFLTTSLTGGICSTALLSMNVLGGVLVYRDHLGSLKAVATSLCVWGFCSYVFGMYIKMKQEKAQEGHRSSGSSTELIPGGNRGDHQA